MPDDHVATAQSALQIGDWRTAQREFELSLSCQETPEAHDGLGVALWWLNHITASHRHRIAAYNGFRERGDLPRAAFIAGWLAREQVFLHSNPSAMNGWFARAERLLTETGDCSQRVWVMLYRASMLAPPSELEAVAAEVISLAHCFGESSLEALAIAFQGSACVSQSRISQGLALIDEAMAAVTAHEVPNLMAISEIFCVTLSACELAGDPVRAQDWCRAAAEFARHYQCSFLSAYCRTTYGSLLIDSGRWQDAENALTDAIALFSAGHHGLRLHALFKLADLRVAQGRLEESTLLLAGFEDHPSALLPLARLHFARGDFSLARSLLEQGIKTIGQPAVGAAPLMLLLVQVLLAAGNTAEAQSVTCQLAALAQAAQSELLLAQADLCAGQIKRQTGTPDPVSDFQSALDRLRDYNHSLLASRARLEMAYTLRQTDPVGAGMWAKAALASLNRLGAAHDAAEAAKFLRELGVTGRSIRSSENLTQRESEILTLLAAGISNREIANRLVISVKTVEHHVSQVLAKTGLRSRAEAAAYVHARDKGNRRSE